VNLRITEREDLPLLNEWSNNSKFVGEYFSPNQTSLTEMEKAFSEPSPFEMKRFIIEKKDGTKIGFILHFNTLHPMMRALEIAYALTPSERRKGYSTEAAKLMVDYLFLSKDTPCVQAMTHIKNVASQGVLREVGFKKEGILRKRLHIRGELADIVTFSILREDWKEPRILTKTTSET
jgi:RimJ/RimL family protein N-acetyltransferase